MQKTWLTIATYMEHMSDSHQRLVDSLRDDILKSVKAQIKDNEKNRRQVSEEIVHSLSRSIEYALTPNLYNNSI